MSRLTPASPNRPRPRSQPLPGVDTSDPEHVDLDLPPDTDTDRRPGASPNRGGRSNATGVLRLGDMADLPASVGLLDAARALGIGRTSAYNLARAGRFPCPLIKVGAVYRVPTAALLRLLALTPESTRTHRANHR